MNQLSPWNRLEDAKLLVSILTPLAIVILGFLFNRRLHKLESEREDTRSKHNAKEQKECDELERRHTPHIEFNIDCKFFGPYQGKYAAEFILTANNKGITKHEFTSIILRLRGIKQDAALAYWTRRYEHRLEFPEKIVEDEVKPNNLNYIFIEPGVTQRLSYITIIDAEIKYITARAEFNYEEYKPHSREKMFEVKSRDTYNESTGVDVTASEGMREYWQQIEK
jgi:hypothetical protein